MGLSKYSHLIPQFEADWQAGMTLTAIGRKYGTKGETVERYLRRSEAVKLNPALSLAEQLGAQAIQPVDVARLKENIKIGDKVTYIKRMEDEYRPGAVRWIKRRGEVVAIYPHGVLADVRGEVVKRFITWADILINDRKFSIN